MSLNFFPSCNTHGQIGSDNKEEALVPRFIDLDERINYIASGSNHNLAITGMEIFYIRMKCELRQKIPRSPSLLFSSILLITINCHILLLLIYYVSKVSLLPKHLIKSYKGTDLKLSPSVLFPYMVL